MSKNDESASQQKRLGESRNGDEFGVKSTQRGDVDAHLLESKNDADQRSLSSSGGSHDILMKLVKDYNEQPTMKSEWSTTSGKSTNEGGAAAGISIEGTQSVISATQSAACDTQSVMSGTQSVMSATQSSREAGVVEEYTEQPTMKDEEPPQKKHAPVKQSRRPLKKAKVADDTVFDNPEDTIDMKADEGKIGAGNRDPNVNKMKPAKIEKNAMKQPKKTPIKANTGDDTVFDNPYDANTRTIVENEKKTQHTDIGMKGPDVNKMAPANAVQNAMVNINQQVVGDKVAKPPVVQNDKNILKSEEKKPDGTESKEKTGTTKVQNEVGKDGCNEGETMRTKKFSKEVVEITARDDEHSVDAVRPEGEAKDEQKEKDQSKSQDFAHSKESYYRTVMDILSIMCLLPLMNDYWEFPVEVARNGGYAFVFLYVIIFVVFVHPTLCFVLFVSQFTQTGLVNVFEMYGPAYEGFGYGYLVLIIVSHMTILRDSSILLKHLRFMFSDNPFMFTCSQPYVQNWSNCSSIFLDSHCMATKTRHDFYAKGTCWRQPPYQFSETSANLYIKYLTKRAGGQILDSEMAALYILHIAVLSGVAFTDPFLLVTFLAVLMVLFFMLTITNFISSINSQAFSTLSQISDFGRLNTAEPWISAIRLAFSSSGLGKVAIFCMSSFRHTHGRYFTTATFVILGKLVVCFLGLSSFFSNFAILYTLDKRHKISFSPENKDLIYFPAFLADVYSFFSDFPHRMLDNAEFIFLYHSVTSLAAVFTISAIARKNEAEKFAEKAHFVIIYVLACSFYAITNCLDILDSKHNSLILACSLHSYMTATIVILYFLYGVYEYRKDVREAFPKSSSLLYSTLEPLHTIILLIVVVLLMILQLYDIIMLCILESTTISELLHNHKDVELLQEIIGIFVAVVPIIIPFAFGVFACLRHGKVKAFTMSEKQLPYGTREMSIEETSVKQIIRVKPSNHGTVEVRQRSARKFHRRHNNKTPGKLITKKEEQTLMKSDSNIANLPAAQ